MNVEKKEVPATFEYTLKLTHGELRDLEVIMSGVAQLVRDFDEDHRTFASTLERALENARKEN